MTLPSIGDRIRSRYRVTEVLAIGGQAIVTCCVDERTGQPVILKRLCIDPASAGYGQELARAKRTAELRFRHPRVVDATDSGTDERGFFVVFPYVLGQDLGQVIALSGGRLSLPRALSIIVDVAEGLVAVHRVGVVHRDLKPSNIIIDVADRARIIDFGVCRRIDEPTITTGSGLVGTPSTMAPEQVRDSHAVDARADIYSLGAVFFECLTGQPPLSTSQVRALTQGHEGPPRVPPSRINPAITSEVDCVVVQMLQDRPEDRFQTVGELLPQLRALRPSSPRSQPGSPMLPTIRSCLACGTGMVETHNCSSCGRRFGSVQHTLVIQSGPSAGATLVLPEGSYVVGREQIAPADVHMSRRQLRVECQNGRVVIVDCGGPNPTCIETQPVITPKALVPGTHVRLGATWATYHRN